MTTEPQFPSSAINPGPEAREHSTVWFGEPAPQPTGTGHVGQPADVQDTPTPPAAPAPGAPPATSASSTATAVGARRPAGPNPAAILLGLLCLAVAAMTISREVSGVVVHLALIGPAVILVAGLVFVLAGLSGLLRRR